MSTSRHSPRHAADRRGAAVSFSVFTALTLALAGVFPTAARAGNTSTLIPYQTYLDFASNKGAFRPGATGAAIPRKTGDAVTVLTDPMVDWAPMTRSGFATLVSPQFVASVAHNVGYKSVTFGDGASVYRTVRRHNFNGHGEYAPGVPGHDDLHYTRLDKLVTETVPAATLEQDEDYALLKSDRFSPYYYRNGNGVQKIGGIDTSVGGYPTGGVDVGRDLRVAFDPVESARPGHAKEHLLIFHRGTDYLTDVGRIPLPNDGRAGDSGSPRFAYDRERGLWVLVGVHHGAGDAGGGAINSYDTTLGIHSLKTVLEDPRENIHVALDPGAVHTIVRGTGVNSDRYCLDGTLEEVSGLDENGRLQQAFVCHGGTAVRGFGIKGPSSEDGVNDSDMDNGQNVHFTGGGVLRTGGPVHTGAGYWHFAAGSGGAQTGAGTGTGTPSVERSASGTFDVVPGTPGATWQGAGLIVDEGAAVTWRLPGVAGDPLKKLGRGTLVLRPEGVNPGTLDIGEGTVELHSSTAGTPAAASVRIVSGRPTVRIAAGDPAAVDPDSLSFGFRGGALDLNGNDWHVAGVHAYDAGARFINTNEAASRFVFLDPASPGAAGRYADRLFEGRFEGNIDLVVEGARNAETDADRVPDSSSSSTSSYGRILTGGFDLPGNTVTIKGERVLMTGAPVRHAVLKAADAAAIREKFHDDSVRSVAVDAAQPDWDDALFKAGDLALDRASLSVGRNAGLVTTGTTLSDSTLTVGTADVVVRPGEVDPSRPDVAPRLLAGRAGEVPAAERARFSGAVTAEKGENRLVVESGRFEGNLAVHDGAHLTLETGSGAEVRLHGVNRADEMRIAPGSTVDLAAGSTPARLETPVMDATTSLFRLGFDPEGDAAPLVRVTESFKGHHNKVVVVPMTEEVEEFEEGERPGADAGTPTGGRPTRMRPMRVRRPYAPRQGSERPRVMIELPGNAPDDAFWFVGPEEGFTEFRPVVTVSKDGNGHTVFVMGKAETESAQVETSNGTETRPDTNEHAGTTGSGNADGTASKSGSTQSGEKEPVETEGGEETTTETTATATTTTTTPPSTSTPPSTEETTASVSTPTPGSSIGWFTAVPREGALHRLEHFAGRFTRGPAELFDTEAGTSFDGVNAHNAHDGVFVRVTPSLSTGRDRDGLEWRGVTGAVGTTAPLGNGFRGAGEVFVHRGTLSGEGVGAFDVFGGGPALKARTTFAGVLGTLSYEGMPAGTVGSGEDGDAVHGLTSAHAAPVASFSFGAGRTRDRFSGVLGTSPVEPGSDAERNVVWTRARAGVRVRLSPAVTGTLYGEASLSHTSGAVVATRTESMRIEGATVPGAGLGAGIEGHKDLGRAGTLAVSADVRYRHFFGTPDVVMTDAAASYERRASVSPHLFTASGSLEWRPDTLTRVGLTTTLSVAGHSTVSPGVTIRLERSF